MKFENPFEGPWIKILSSVAVILTVLIIVLAVKKDDQTKIARFEKPLESASKKDEKPERLIGSGKKQPAGIRKLPRGS